jgi:hypothetical protein
MNLMIKYRTGSDKEKDKSRGIIQAVVNTVMK